MRKTLLVFASLSLFGLGLVGLAFRQTTLDKADFTYVSGAEPKTLDPHLMTGQIEGRFGLAMFEGLTYWDAKTLNNAPGMAERWDISEDERTWTFYFRDAKWSNGDPVTAHDFVWSWKRALDPMTVSEYYYMLKNS